MPWFKVDDTLALHPKVLTAGNAAIGLWVRAGSWAMQQLTDGFVPAHIARTLGSPTEARRLVESGLWDVVDGGYQFHQWTDVQRTKEQVKADRDAATERQRHARERAKSQRESRRDTAVSHGPPVSRPPDQTRPDQTNKDSEADKPPRPAKRTRLPDAFVPSDEHVSLASSLGVNLGTEWPKFQDHWRGTGETKADWSATLRNWIRRANEGNGARRPVEPVRRLVAAHELELPPDGLSPEEYAAWDRDQRARRATR